MSLTPRLRDLATQVLLAGLAGVLLFWGLADKYLWQDEANTAVLAARLLKYGKPLAYDGVNLVTIDFFATEHTGAIAQRTGDPKATLDFYVRRGDFKPDTAWIWHPWGQFVIAAAGLKLLGNTTLGARLPFALAGMVTVLMLYRLVRKFSGSWPMATISALLLLANAYWILHARQCRYYSLSSLLLVLTVMAYLRWQDGERWGSALLVLSGWCWFQVDYGAIWPVFGVLFLDAFLARRRTFREVWTTGMALAAAIAPFLIYYRLWGRKMTPVRDRRDIFEMNWFNVNEYVAPLLLILAAVALVIWQWDRLSAAERHLVAICCAVLTAFLAWVPAATPEAFLRYVIMTAPLGCLLSAWLLVRGLGAHGAPFAWLGALVLALTPLASLPGRLPVSADNRYDVSPWWRTEQRILFSEIFGHRPDPNRLTVEYLRRNAAPSDEILINYEDMPLMFYLPNPIRGGIPAFRAEDDARTPPRFIVMRKSVEFVHKDIFAREIARYRWENAPDHIPDVLWGNNPDPMMWDQYPADLTDLTLARRKD